MAIPKPLIEHLNRGDCVLFAGEGCDAAPGCVSAAQLAAELVAETGMLCNWCQREQGRLPKEQRRCLHPQACDTPLARAAHLYQMQHGRQALADFILQRFPPAQPPGAVLNALAALPVRVIVTSLLDERLERALGAAGRKYRSVVRDTDVPFGDPHYVQVIHLRGVLSQPDSLVLTREDERDWFARLRPRLRTQLLAYFASSTLLFIGYDLNRPDFEDLYGQVSAQVDPADRSQRRHYAVQWPADPQALDYWQGRIQLLEQEALDFIAEARRSLGQMARQERAEAEQQALPPEPYKFLDYFTHQDTRIFFGRELEGGLLLSTVLAHRLSVFYGRSGTGKTSLLLAGLQPVLEQKGYKILYARMLGNPASEIKAALRGVKVDALAPADRESPLPDFLARALPGLAGEPVIVLDQFEEFFIRQGEEVRKAFAQELAECLALDLRFVLSLRDDYLGRLDELAPYLPQDVFAHRFRLENLSREKALLAILKPAEAFGLPVEETLQEQLLHDLEDQGLETANLQIVLHSLYQDAIEQGLWRAAANQTLRVSEILRVSPLPGLTLARYQALGGTRSILAGYLDKVIAGLPEAQQPQAQAVLKSMVTAQRTKVAVSDREIARSELLGRLGLAEAALNALLAYLRQQRVVRKFGDEERYELAHEVMVEKVWAWVSDEELRLLDVRDSLRRGMSDYKKFGHLLERQKLELLTPHAQSLQLDDDEGELLLRSALAAGYAVPFWFERAAAGGVGVQAIAEEGLKAEKWQARVAAVKALAALAQENQKFNFCQKLNFLLADDYPQVRIAAIRALEALQPSGEWRAHLKYECYVPAGAFSMGDGEEESEYNNTKTTPHEVSLAAFYIARYPVTNAEYKRFMADREQTYDIPAGKEQHPVANVSWHMARQYCAWAGMRLPSEAEWEKAASWQPGPDLTGFSESAAGRVVGADGRSDRASVRGNLSGLLGRKRVYPWGDAFDKNKCNTEESGINNTTRVGQYSPDGDSPYGCADMAGNVWEWTSSLYKPYPYRAQDGREDAASPDKRVLRGGSYQNDQKSARCAVRFWGIPASFLPIIDGFRVVASLACSDC